MSILLSPVQRALAARTRAEAVDAVGPGRLSLTQPDLQRLTAMLLAGSRPRASFCIG